MTDVCLHDHHLGHELKENCGEHKIAGMSLVWVGRSYSGAATIIQNLCLTTPNIHSMTLHA